MYPDPFDHDIKPESYRSGRPRPRWLSLSLALVMIASLFVPVLLALPSAMRNLYLTGLILMVGISVAYRLIFAAIFGERAARREFRLPRAPRDYRLPIAPKPPQDRIQTADGTWLQIVDDGDDEAEALNAIPDDTPPPRRRRWLNWR